MSAIATIQPIPPAPLPDPYRPTNMEQAMNLAKMVASSDLAPKDYKGKPANVFVAMQMGHELGLSPMQSIQNIAVINGRPSVWGDALLALCQAHPSFIDLIETDDGTTATATLKRRGRADLTRTFSVDDAKRAGLLGKQGPWSSYPARMRQMRARGFCLRDGMADVLRGLSSAEEQEDIVHAEVIPSAAVDVTPQASEPAKSAVEKTKAAVRAKKEAAEQRPTIDGVLAGIDAAETLAELDRVAVLANKLDAEDKAKAREVFKAKKQTLQRNADLVNEPPPHDPETGEVQTDWDEAGREPGELAAIDIVRAALAEGSKP